MSSSFYSFSEPFNSGIDFYQADATNVAIDISVTSSLTITSQKITFAIISIDSSSIVVSNSHKIAHASANLAIDGATVVVATERQDGSVVINSEVLVETNITKISFASASLSSSGNVGVNGTKVVLSTCEINVESNTSISIYKIAHSSSQLSSLLDLFVSGKKIVLADANISGQIGLAIVGKIVLATIRIAMSQIADIDIKNVIKFAENLSALSGGSDPGMFKTLVLIDGKPLTNHNRKLDMSIEPIFTEAINWANSKSRYFKSTARSGRRIFNISWSYLPNSTTYTVDGNRGRDFIKDIAQDPRHHVLKIINMDESGTTPYSETSYNVLVKDYNETLIRRDIPNEVYLWDCSMSFEEV